MFPLDSLHTYINVPSGSRLLDVVFHFGSPKAIFEVVPNTGKDPVEYIITLCPLSSSARHSTVKRKNEATIFYKTISCMTMHNSSNDYYHLVSRVEIDNNHNGKLRKEHIKVDMREISIPQTPNFNVINYLVYVNRLM